MQILLAILPVLPSLLDFYQALWLGAVVAAAFWTTTFFFRLALFFLPQKVKGIVLIFWLAVWAQAGWYFFGLAPMWVGSVWLLGDSHFFRGQVDSRVERESNKTYLSPKKVTVTCFCFWLLAAWLGLGAEILGRGLGLAIFLQPAGTFLLAGTALVLWQPREEAVK